jgi:hypothetical protein
VDLQQGAADVQFAGQLAHVVALCCQGGDDPELMRVGQGRKHLQQSSLVLSEVRLPRTTTRWRPKTRSFTKRAVPRAPETTARRPRRTASGTATACPSYPLRAAVVVIEKWLTWKFSFTPPVLQISQPYPIAHRPLFAGR